MERIRVAIMEHIPHLWGLRLPQSFNQIYFNSKTIEEMLLRISEAIAKLQLSNKLIVDKINEIIDYINNASTGSSITGVDTELTGKVLKTTISTTDGDLSDETDLSSLGGTEVDLTNYQTPNLTSSSGGEKSIITDANEFSTLGTGLYMLSSDVAGTLLPDYDKFIAPDVIVNLTKSTTGYTATANSVGNGSTFATMWYGNNDIWERVPRMDEVGGGIILPNACPVEAIVISSLADIVNATDLGGSYCLQSNIVMDTSVHGVIDGFYGTINLNGYSISTVGGGELPFINFKGGITGGVILTQIIDNITSDNEGVQIPTIQNTQLNSKLCNTCDTTIFLYGVITNTTLGTFSSNLVTIDTCKFTWCLGSNNYFITGSVNDLIIKKSYITNKSRDTSSSFNLTYKTMTLEDCKVLLSFSDTTSSIYRSVGELIPYLPIGSTVNATNILVVGGDDVFLSSGTSTTHTFSNLVGQNEGTYNLTNYINMKRNYIHYYTSNNTDMDIIKPPIGTGLYNNTNVFYLDSTENIRYVASSPGEIAEKKYVGDTVTPTYQKVDITKENFVNIGFDPAVWDLDMIGEGYIPNLKNGSSFQQKELISSLPERTA